MGTENCGFPRDGRLSGLTPSHVTVSLHCCSHGSCRGWSEKVVNQGQAVVRSSRIADSARAIGGCGLRIERREAAPAATLACAIRNPQSEIRNLDLSLTPH